MFHKEWAYKTGNNIEVLMLPYFFTDQTTGEVIEMTNCSPEKKKQLGWYEIEFVNNSGNRANTFYESINTVYYNKIKDSVECHSFTVKNNWRTLIFNELERKIKSLPLYNLKKEKLDVWIEKIRVYFFNEKYDTYQIAKYFNILNFSTFDILSFVDMVEYQNSENIKLIEYLTPYEEIFRSKEIVTKYFTLNTQQLSGKKVLLTGVGCYGDAVLLVKKNISCAILDNVFFDLGVGKFYINVASVLNAINNDVFVNIIEESEYDYSEDDILVFNGAFESWCAQKNWDMALAAKKKGKQVLICSPSILAGTNGIINVSKDEIEIVFQLDNEIIFSPI